MHKLNFHQKSISIFFLWSEVTGYVEATLKELVKLENVKINVVYWDRKNINSSKFVVSGLDGIFYHKRTECSTNDIFNLLFSRHADLIVVSGWMDYGYINACKKYRKRNPSVKVLAGIDDQLKGSWRQFFGRFYFKFRYQSLFDFLWLSGKPQMAYANYFGYGIDKVIFDLYSADSNVFLEKSRFGKRFVFVGRFVNEKSILLLIEAYNMLESEIQKLWPLYLIGDGELKADLDKLSNENIIIIPFLQPDNLRDELSLGGIACLPSYLEPWGVVVQEYCQLGMPLLLSTGCGSATEFLISGYNGYLFERGNVYSLYNALREFVNSTDAELKLMGDRSFELAKRIDPERSAASLLSVLNRF